MVVLMNEAVREIDVPLVAQPNAGMPQVADDGTLHYAQSPDDFATDMAAIATQGVRLVGGCCGTDDRFIAALHHRLRDRSDHESGDRGEA